MSQERKIKKTRGWLESVQDDGLSPGVRGPFDRRQVEWVNARAAGIVIHWRKAQSGTRITRAYKQLGHA
uniref:Transposase n=1 Tax=Peronospora matthiolae TaxID=2874970 RepID=A0AAV1U8C5_9STRA